MTIDLIFEWNDHGWCPTTTYVKYYHELKKLHPDIEINHIDAVQLRLEAEKQHQYFGHASRYGPFYMMVRNRDTNKFTLVSYWDSIKDIFESPYCFFDLGKMQQLITSIGVVVNDIEFKPITYLKYTPFGYVPLTPECEREIEKLYEANSEKTIPDRPRFRNFPNDPFRQFIMNDQRFEGIDKRTNLLPIAEYMAELYSHKIGLSLNGHGEICHRDMEILGMGNVLLRPKFVVNFHEPLIPDYHFVAVEFDDYKNHKDMADRFIDKYNKIKNDKDYLDFVGKNGREWYLRNGCTTGNANLLTKIVNLDLLK